MPDILTYLKDQGIPTDDLYAMIATRACVDTVEPDDLLDDLCLDPVDLWGLRDDIERGFGMIIPDSAMEKWHTVSDITATELEVVTA